MVKPYAGGLYAYGMRTGCVRDAYGEFTQFMVKPYAGGLYAYGDAYGMLTVKSRSFMVKPYASCL